ncbi:MAG: alpha-glucan family phosphorylase [bacterium]
MSLESTIAYFSMEIGIIDQIKSYAGGLGILAGDTLRAGCDLGLPMVGVTLLYKYGYFKQELDKETGLQHELNDTWDYTKLLQKVQQSFQITIEGKPVQVEIWKYDLIGVNGAVLPVYFLNVDLEVNAQNVRYASYTLYTKYEETRIIQEIILGVGGVHLLKTLGYNVGKYHLNESDAALASLPLLIEQGQEQTKKKIIFTTHTPIPAGHKSHDIGLMQKYLAGEHFSAIHPIAIVNNRLQYSLLCLENSSYVNGVSKLHGQVSGRMFPQFKIDSITNGIHSNFWASPSMRELFDQTIPGWRQDSDLLVNAMRIKDAGLQAAHSISKQDLINSIQQKSGKNFSTDRFTIGFARRADGYKRADFIFRNLAELNRIAAKFGGIQFVFSGKSYPDVAVTEGLISQIYLMSKDNNSPVQVVFLEDYSIDVARKIVAGSDMWLNNPRKPQEASGTSGMKAALNGVPNFSILDGWWAEGCIEGVTGWSIGENCLDDDENCELNDLYEKLEYTILPLFHSDKAGWAKIQKQAIALNAGYFHTHRMVKEYLVKGYLR